MEIGVVSWIDEGWYGRWLPSAMAGSSLNGTAEGELLNWSSSWLNSKRGGYGWHTDVQAQTQACGIEGECLRLRTPWPRHDGGNRGGRRTKAGRGETKDGRR